ncbi:hypothetical protein, unlikely [Trypanosoma brucei gambiense DAL972]|uniref:Uncharacterized protein n=1 Tax=Trypanosoma brucei gambiense (strain MHOM/CI/86/DAL972) TaxID=679716 RepID=D0A099_TRYB9|nr:hypothetical protein, unlikely [Trypanosoma brucei gambiense DAL972]CBH16657.1 hypothetical protein, unlikely [Trypanosoma brucei gambiense DAL972]|eukprot:XP_011778921.1 hypothetical protein, unlikely [Trypanosoma brucei gambiense DAL972]
MQGEITFSVQMNPSLTGCSPVIITVTSGHSQRAATCVCNLQAKSYRLHFTVCLICLRHTWSISHVKLLSMPIIYKKDEGKGEKKRKKEEKGSNAQEHFSLPCTTEA